MNTLRRQFPLTPDLSLRERETRRQSVGECNAPRTIKTRALLFPLPGGEGNGEGERDALQSLASDISKAHATLLSQVCPG